MTFQQLNDIERVELRHPRTRQVHNQTLWSPGPNEEWCADGHEKLNVMGIHIYGLNDKFSRYELGLFAVPNAKKAEVPLALYLRIVKEHMGT